MVKETCKAQGISQGDLAERLGVSRNTIQSGMRIPGSVGWDSAEALCEVAEASDEERVALLDAWCVDRTEHNRLQAWIRSTEAALRVVLKPDQLQRLKAERVAAQASLERARGK
ncbi:MAG: helix-turn-helix transcriptional regulator [Gemmatimonadetes bacterium]|nr:helix-turn-helix transcriptional regulator [Gemmatimonadota bacterium]